MWRVCIFHLYYAQHDGDGWVESRTNGAPHAGCDVCEVIRCDTPAHAAHTSGCKDALWPVPCDAREVHGLGCDSVRMGDTQVHVSDTSGCQFRNRILIIVEHTDRRRGSIDRLAYLCGGGEALESRGTAARLQGAAPQFHVSGSATGIVLGGEGHSAAD